RHAAEGGIALRPAGEPPGGVPLAHARAPQGPIRAVGDDLLSERLPDIVQTDFSGGEIKNASKRRDDLPFVKTGGRAVKNWRIEASGTLLQRPGKRPVFPTPGSRNEYVRMQGDAEVIMNFGWSATAGGLVTSYSLDGTGFVQNGGYDWNPSSINSLCFCIAQFDIVICGPSANSPGANFQPQIARWNPPD